MTARPNVDLIDPVTFADGPPHHIVDELRLHAPVKGQPTPFEGTIWSLTRHADIREAATNVAEFSSAHGIVYPNTPERLAFSPCVVARLELAGNPVRLPGLLVNGLRQLPLKVLQ